MSASRWVRKPPPGPHATTAQRQVVLKAIVQVRASIRLVLFLTRADPELTRQITEHLDVALQALRFVCNSTYTERASEADELPF